MAADKDPNSSIYFDPTNYRVIEGELAGDDDQEPAANLLGALARGAADKLRRRWPGTVAAIVAAGTLAIPTATGHATPEHGGPKPAQSGNSTTRD